MRINKLELISIIEIVLNHLNSKEEIDVREEFYWDIPMKEIYQPYEIPKDLTIGQISDDWQELQKLLHHDSRDAVGYDFKRISTILKVISHNCP
jgi:hypothetical protein